MKTRHLKRFRTRGGAASGPPEVPGKASFGTAVRQHLAGDLDAALASYDDVLARWPAYAEAHHNAGVILAQRGRLQEAIIHFRRAVESNSGYAEAHHSLALALNMVNTDGARREAIGAFRRAAELNPTSVDWWTDLGTLLNAEGQFAGGLEANDRALALDPDSAQMIANRAVPLRGLHRYQEAVAACRASLAVRPDSAATLVNLGMVLRECSDLDGARDAFDRALAIAPRHLNARMSVAAVLLQQGQHVAARTIAEEILSEHPESAEGWTLLGGCALEAAEFALAEQCQREALARSPDYSSAQWNLAQLRLVQGDFTEGLRFWEARKRLDVFTRHNHDSSEWNGEPLDGRTILVHAEQGFGDSIQFVRLLPALKVRGAGRVILDQCPPELASLLRAIPGVDQLVVRGERAPAFDVHVYLMSLPFLFGMTLDTIPRAVPYLRATDRPVANAIRASGPGVRVGLAWTGNHLQMRDRIRSVDLEALAPVLATPGVTFFSLQKGEGRRDLESTGHRGIVDLAPALVDFSDTAAAIDALDLVITVDTSVAHLSGALAKPVWLLAARVPDWRWFLDREDSPWYPTMRLFRQTALNDWEAPVTATSRALAEFVRAQAEDAPGGPERVASRGEANDALCARVDAALGAGTDAAPIANSPLPARVPIEIDWPVGFTSGWGTYGLQLALALGRSSRAEPVLVADPVLWGVNPLAAHQLRAMRRTIPTARAAGAIHLTALGNGLQGAVPDARARSGRQVGIVFFEDTALDAAAKERTAGYDRIIAGSSWNVDVLEAHGVPHVRLVLQGVDPSVFHPAPRTGLMGNRFLVFSGGKLEFRKGQDIVVEAFRRFHATHRDALLVTAWHNHWPHSMEGIDAMGYVRGHPSVRDGHCETAEWLVANGLAPGSVLDLGLQPQATMAHVLREMDVAVFTNRCEGGTNLVAMEAMACGVPTILSANTGHLDLIRRDTVFALEQQPAVSVTTPAFRGMSCWGESDPSEVVAMLERAYDDRTEARRRGAEGAKQMAQLPWDSQCAALLCQIDA